MSFQPGDVIDNKYRVVRLIGEGGMGAVYEGENTRISRRVAIKVLRTEAANRPELAERFEREARAAARIGSKYVCDVLDLGDLPNGDSYLVMELLEGEDLASRLKSLGRMPDAEALTVAYQLTDGLATMHEAGIIHRDLKPANVFLSKGSHGRDTVKILDFGVSKFAAQQNESLHMTATGAVMGTPLYMSPEQARGAKDIDARSDLYAVGVVLYKAVTGKLPFRGDNFNEILFKIALDTPPSVMELAPDVDPAFAAIIERAMEKDPAARFQTARELNEALYALGTERGVVLESSVSIPPPGSLTPGRGVSPASGLPRLPPPSRVPGFAPERIERTMNLPMPLVDNESAAVPLTALSGAAQGARRSSMPPAAQMQEIVADGFTATAWAGNERASSPPTPHSNVSVNAPAEHATPHPSTASPRARLTATLSEDNRRAAAKTRKIAFGVVGFLGIAVASFVVATRINASASSDATPAALDTASAQAAPAVIPSAAPAQATAAATTSAGVDVAALPLANGASVVPTVQPNALPIAKPGANAPVATPVAPMVRTVETAPPPSASAEPKKRDWGVIAPAVPTVEKPPAPPEPAP